MAVDRAARSLLSVRSDAILNRVLKAGEFVPESKFISSRIGNIVEGAKPKRKTDIIDVVKALKKRVKKYFGDLNRRQKPKVTATTDGKPRNASCGVEYKKKESVPASTQRTRNAQAPINKPKKARTNPIKSGVKRAVSNIRKSAARVFAQNAGEYASFIFSKEGIRATHRYLDTVVKTEILRQASEIRFTAVRKFLENRLDYKKCLRTFKDSLEAYHKALIKGDRVDVMFAKSNLLDAKTSLEIAAKYMKLSEESCRNMAA